MRTEHMVSQGGTVIFNPTAGRGQGGQLRAQAQALLGESFDWIPTRRPGDAIELAREAARHKEIVVAFGGDGTVGDVARGIYGTEATLGILPVGTGNDVARNLALSLRLDEACATVLNGVVRRIDMGLLNGTPFVNNAGLGFDAQVMRTMNASLRFVRGYPAFLLAILKVFPSFRPFTLTYQADDGSPVTCKAMMVSLLNGKMYGAGMRAAPDAEIDDGRLDVLVIKAMNKLQLLPLIQRVKQGTHAGHPAVELFQARQIQIQAIPPQPLNIDGDLRGLTPIEVSVAPRALKVLVR